MLKKIFKIIALITVFLLPIQFALSNELILPKKKPALSDEIIKEKIIKSEIFPLKKPSQDDEVQITKKDEVKKKKVTKILDGEIIPKNKPLVVNTAKAKKAKKSKYYSKKDFEIGKTSIKYMEQRKWTLAEKTAKKAKDKSIYKFIRWKHLITTGNQLSFYDYKAFIQQSPNYPRIGRVKYLAEHKISTKNLSPKSIIEWFNQHPPLSGFGKLVLGEALISKGDVVKGKSLIKSGWITADLSRDDMKFFRKKFKKILNSSDYIKRADYLSYENKYWDLKRMLRYLPKDYELLYTARQLLMSRSYGVDTAISKVPNKLKNDAGLNYDRLKWRRKRGRVDSSL